MIPFHSLLFPILFYLAFSPVKAEARLNAAELLEQSMTRGQPIIDWSQPAIGCSEEMIPGLPDRDCLDLSNVPDALNDWPSSISSEEHQFWYSHRRYLSYCRAKELLHREGQNPGSQSFSHIEVSWMLERAVENYTENVAAVAEANKIYGIPQAILTGALYQESIFSNLGIGEDGGNYSCGIGQINIIGWCKWANAQNASAKNALNWPKAQVECDNQDLVRLKFLSPLYAIAKMKLGSTPEYKLDKTYFANIALSDVIQSWPAASPSTQQLRFQLIQSFIENCSNTRNGILAAAQEISTIYHGFISSALQQKDHYPEGQNFKRSCAHPDSSTAYPLHTGWLLAVASYNSGPRAVNAVAFYNKWTRAEYQSPQSVKDLSPDALVASLYWAGKYNYSTDLIDYATFQNSPESWPWFTACVVQRHIARVMQNVTLLPEYFVNSLEGAYPCAKSVYDSNGKLVQSAVPPFRQTSSGTK